MKTIFKQLQFNRVNEYRNPRTLTNAEFHFFIPGVNSGIYSPATLYVRVRLEEKVAGFFRFKKSVIVDDITLTPNEFDELYDEMTKIKKLRDALK